MGSSSLAYFRDFFLFLFSLTGVATIAPGVSLILTLGTAAAGAASSLGATSSTTPPNKQKKFSQNDK
jgi:hypothetical protein